MKKDEKQLIIEDLHGRAKRAKMAVITEYRGLDVAKLNELRKILRGVSVEYQVVKNTLLGRASEGTILEKIQGRLAGPNGVVMVYGDPVEPAKVLIKFAKENDKFLIKFGVLGNREISPEDLTSLSKLPGREVLLAQVLGAMSAVPASLVRALADAPRRMLNVLNARVESLEKAA